MNLPALFRSWWRSTLIPAPPARKPRPKMGKVVCPGCQRQMAYSSVTQLTARHRCVGGHVAQRPIGPNWDTSASGEVSA